MRLKILPSGTMRVSKLFALALLLGFCLLQQVEAASLQLTPNTGVYTTGSTFTTKVVVNTEGKPINAAEGVIKYNPTELAVVSVNRSSSIFNLWVTEPSFSNSAGTISFSGGLPSGYTGGAGAVFSVTFKTLKAGTARISYTGGSVLANDGLGTNILSGMNGGTYTIQAPSSQPVAEEIEYIAPANTPAIPKISSTSHQDPLAWSNKNSATLSWFLPEDVIAVRTLLDSNPTTVPTRVYETPIKNIALNDLPEGENYFHLQFRNAVGWGKVAHYRLAIDTRKPESFTVSRDERTDVAAPQQVILLKAEQLATDSPVRRFMVKIDNQDAYEYIDKDSTGSLTLPVLAPGYHAIIIEAFDAAGNSSINTTSVTISAFSKPEFTEYPQQINEEVIPVIRGNTRAKAVVTISLQKIGGSALPYKTVADEAGIFTFIPEGTFTQGVYELTATAVDEYGAQSDISDPIRIAVQQPGYIQVGERLIGVLSIIIPLLGMTALLGISFWLLVVYVRRLRKKVSIESKEVTTILSREFSHLLDLLEKSKEVMTETRKTKKLTSAEEEIFSELKAAIAEARQRVGKEVHDVEELVEKKTK